MRYDLEIKLFLLWVIAGAILLFWLLPAFADNPVVITQGGVYSGVWTSDNPSVPAVRVNAGGAIVEIAYSVIVSRGDGIDMTANGGNVIIHDCHLIGRNSQQYGVENGFGILCQNPQGVQIYNNFFQFWRTHVALRNPVGSPYTGPIFWIDNNLMYDCEGQPSNGNGDYLSGIPGNGGSIIVQNLVGVIYGEIGWNQIENHPGISSPTDQISIYASSGQPGQLISVHDNYIHGIFQSDPSLTGQNTSTGILTDGYPYGSQFVSVTCNQVVGALATGIGFAYSQDCIASGNRVVNAAINPWTLQLYVNQYLSGMAVYEADATNVVTGNVIGVNQSAPVGERNDTPPWPWGTYLNNASLHPGVITLSDEDTEAGIWQKKVRDNEQIIGPQ